MINNIPKSRFYIYKLLTWVTLLNHAESVCFKSTIQSGRSLFLSKIKKNTSLKLPVGVSLLQLVNLHRNRGYFVIKLHTWFCLSYFLKTNFKFYCIYQYFMSINSLLEHILRSIFKEIAGKNMFFDWYMRKSVYA